MKDYLDQIIAYAPEKINRMQLAEVPRSEMDNFNTPDLEQSPDSFLRPGETLEDFDVTFRRPNAQGGRIPFGKGGDVEGLRTYLKNLPEGAEVNVKELAEKFKVSRGTRSSN